MTQATQNSNIATQRNIWALDSATARHGNIEVVIIGAVNFQTGQVLWNPYKKLTAYSVCHFLDFAIVNWGLPSLLRTDNSSLFFDAKFKVFLQKRGINLELTRSSYGGRDDLERELGEIANKYVEIQAGA